MGQGEEGKTVEENIAKEIIYEEKNKKVSILAAGSKLFSLAAALTVTHIHAILNTQQFLHLFIVAPLWFVVNGVVFGGVEMIGGGCFHYNVQLRPGDAPRDAGSRG